jgi:hypothetical protein
MRYQSTVFGQLLKAVPRCWFERSAQEHHRGRKKRTLPAWKHLVVMVLAQLSGSRSLRDLERMVEQQPGAMAHLGVGAIARSTLSDANRVRPAALFEAVAAHLCAQAGGGKLGREGLRLIDATRIYAGKRVEAWAKGGVKLHICLAPDEQRPVWFAVTRDRVNDITPAKAMPIEPGLTYVFDKGYYDFSFWAALHAAECRFVTRIKKNSPVCVVKERKARGEGIVFDRIVELSQRLAGQRRNPFQARARLIGITIETTDKPITLLTNDLTTSAAKIAALYKARWQVEIFFKWIKQNLKLAHFLGTSQNALTIQIMAALIAFLLIRLAAGAYKTSLGLQALARLMPTILFLRRPLSDVFTPPDPTTQNAAKSQLELAYA